MAVTWSCINRHRDFLLKTAIACWRFAIPATRVEIYLTTQPRLQLKHEHDVVNAVGDVYGAEVFQAGLHQLSLFPRQAEMLDFDYMDESEDDVKFLWGPPGKNYHIFFFIFNKFSTALTLCCKLLKLLIKIFLFVHANNLNQSKSL